MAFTAKGSTQIRLSSLNISDYPTYLVMEVDKDRDIFGNINIVIQNSKKSIYKEKLSLLEKTIKDTDAHCTSTDLLNEMDVFGYEVYKVFGEDDDGLLGKVHYIFRKKQ
jgi:hypothetical protein